MNRDRSEQTLYVDEDEPVCVGFHPGASQQRSDLAVVICPPFGWDEVCSYRPRWEWARELSRAGYPTARLSFPSTGDSAGSPRDPARVKAWIDAVGITATWVRDTTEASRVAAIGIGLGGIIAYCATAGGAALDDLVLWGAPSRGRAMLRELRAFSKLEFTRFFEGLQVPPSLPEGELEAGGFLLSAQTTRDLDAIDVASLPLPASANRQVLLLERDGIAPEAELIEAVKRSGAEVRVAPGEGYGAMTSHPQRAQAPREVMALVTRWLEEGREARGRAGSETPSAPKPYTPGPESAVATSQARPKTVMSSAGGVEVAETPFSIPQPFGALRGIISEPVGKQEHGVCALLLNAGAVRRTGPSRMWVELARRWAGRGVNVVRLDVEGIGDSDGDAGAYAEDAGLYVPRLIPQVLHSMDVLEQRGLGSRFVLVGLCAGAYWSFHAALQDHRVSAALMLNPRALIWDEDLAPARDFKALLGSKRSWSRIRRNATPERVRALSVWMLGAPKRKLTRRDEAVSKQQAQDEALDKLRTMPTRAMFLFATGEPLEEELAESGWLSLLEQQSNVTIERIPVRDHTMRPTWAQGLVHQALDRALERELADAGTTAGSVMQGAG
ncbi:MAG: alpha/beta fold hydrolase [Solirubrobacterales bacterium]|nr:alpha/beta fold hydrolase [Solirubrobacterales bacterium]